MTFSDHWGPTLIRASDFLLFCLVFMLIVSTKSSFFMLYFIIKLDKIVILFRKRRLKFSKSHIIRQKVVEVFDFTRVVGYSFRPADLTAVAQHGVGKVVSVV